MRLLKLERLSAVTLAAVIVGVVAAPPATGSAETVSVARSGQSVWIQVGAHSSGLAGSQWRTDLGLRNVSSAQANVEVKLYPSGGGAVKTKATFVPAGAQSVLEDVVGQLGYTGSGAIEVSSDQPVVITSRTYNQIAAGASCTPGGTFGQYYAGYTLAQGLGTGGSAWLAHLAESSRFRSNLAFTNMGSSAATVRVELFDGAGTLLTSFDVTLNPGQYKQETQVFKNRAGQTVMQRGSARISITAGSGIIASASVVDNVTNDPTTIPMQQVTGAGATPEEVTITLPGNVPLTLVRIPKGTFLMGSPESERGRTSSELQHQVTISQDYYVGKHEVTQRQWIALKESNPALFASCGLDCPVERVSWDDICGGSTASSCTASSFIGKLNAHLTATGQPSAGKLRLPTEAEWERAARGGTTGPFSFDTSANPSWDVDCGSFPQAEPYMWWCGNSGAGTHPVGQKLANPFGLHDMHGNVGEWVADWYGNYPSGAVTDPTGPSSGTYRAHRPGYVDAGAKFSRSAHRTGAPASNTSQYRGFRVAASL